MAQLTGIGLAEFVKTKLGTPYVYGAKGADGKFTQRKLDSLKKAYPKVFSTNYLNKIIKKSLVGKVCCDCSGLISWYTGKVLGSAQLYSTAYARMPISEWKNFAIGTVLWKSGHVGVYIGDGYVIEEKGIDYGCVKTHISATKWKYGLTFSWMDYTIDTKVESEKITYKDSNPYPIPIRNLKNGHTGDDVKWLQWELKQAGYNITVDGIFGNNTEKILIKFQNSAKITNDGICGPATRKALTSKVGNNPYTEPKVLLKLGSKGVGVKWLQWELKQAGYNISIDGDFGNKTFDALCKFQKFAKITNDGICGSATRKALIAAI